MIEIRNMFGTFEFAILKLFRISNFVLRIYYKGFFYQRRNPIIERNRGWRR
jgi:hypothetical protein